MSQEGHRKVWNMCLGIRTEYLPMQVSLVVRQSFKSVHVKQGCAGELMSPFFTYTFFFFLRLTQILASDFSDTELILEQ
jgi:hypothetical protein